MDSKKITIISVVIFLALSSAFCFGKWILAERQIKIISQEIKRGQVNEKVLFFSKLLTEKVLSGAKEVSFEDRLKLENAVRDLKDSQILAQWQKFTQSETGAESQQNFTDLLKILLQKISY